MRPHGFSAPISRVLLMVPLATGVLAAPAAGQVVSGDLTLRLETVASGLAAPVYVTHAGDGSGRLFVVDQAGQIRVVNADGTLRSAPFLDLAAELPALNQQFDERGLLGLAFHPQYATNGRFFVRYSHPRAGVPGEPCFGLPRGCHEEILAEYRVSPTDPDLADPTSGVILFRVDEPEFNHNAGMVRFGPDGMLYFTLGDGGGANDGFNRTPPAHGPEGNAQPLTTPLGKMLRVDVSTPGVMVAPPDNPYFGATPGLDIIWANGLRNPFQFSFDDFGPGATGALIVADVGQNLFEEINIMTRGGNYGWPIREGFHCFDRFTGGEPPATCQTEGLTDPIAEYGRDVGISVIGGYVYRGSRFPGLAGKYVFGDFSTAFTVPDGHLFYLDHTGAAPVTIFRPRLGGSDASLGLFIKGTGRDAAGEIYILASSSGGPGGAGGVVLRVAPCPSDADGSGRIQVADIFIFLRLWFAHDARADFDSQNGVQVADIFAFLRAWFSGC